MVISDYKVFIVFVALGLPFPQVHLSVGGAGGQLPPTFKSGGGTAPPPHFWTCLHLKKN